MAVPRIVLTAGEPAGIGPDIILMAAQRAWDAQLVVAADPELLQQRAAQLGFSVQLQTLNTSAAPRPQVAGTLTILPVALTTNCQPGVLDPTNANYVLTTLREAVATCRSGVCQALVTGPVQKSVINDAGIAFIGHTEFLAQETGAEQVVMMLATEQLRVALATTHLPLHAVPGAITQDLLRKTLTVLHQDLHTIFGIEHPHIAVLGVNPHAGEGGHMGREEIEVVEPVLNELRKRGFQLRGPLPADTAFNPNVLEHCDAVFAMYHDQGLPVLKYSGFGRAINITLGLPIIRTSVDHGTALALAGTGEADAGSLEQAISVAMQLSN